MEKLSRVKKYEELRKSIEQEIENADAIAVKQAAENLSNIEAVSLKRANIETDTYVPEREKTKVEEPELGATTIDDFTNEYLDDFLKEVREYNIKKGTREYEDTQLDILNQLHQSSHLKRNQYVQEIEEDVNETIEAVESTLSLNKEDIASQVQSLLEEENEPVEEPTEKPSFLKSIFMKEEEKLDPSTEVEIERVEPKTEELHDLEKDHEKEIQLLHQKHEEEKEERNRLLEETQQLRVQLNEYEEELTDLSDGVEKNNKILNIVLGVLIVALLVVVGLIAFMIWQAKMGGKI